MKLKAIITNRVFLAVTASVLGIGLASGAVFSVMYRPSETPFVPDSTPEQTESRSWSVEDTPTAAEADSESNTAGMPQSLADKLKLLTAGTVAEAYSVTGEPEAQQTEPESTVVSSSQKQLPASAPVIRQTDSSRSVLSTAPQATEKPQSGTVVKEYPVPTQPPSASGTQPQSDQWPGRSDSVPQELYEYPYTVVPGYETITGAQLAYNGYTDMPAAAEAVRQAVAKKFTVDYRNITSTVAEDRDPYLCDLVYYTGESSQYDIANYMRECVDNQIVSQAEFITDPSLMYNSYHNMVRGRLKVKFDSGAEHYGLQNGVWYWRDVEVAVKKNNGEDRFGYGQTNDYHCLLFLTRGFVPLSDYQLLVE